MANYGREVRIGEDIWKKGEVEKATEFVERMKRVQKKVGAALKKAQEEMKRGEGLEKERQSNAKYKRLNIQRKTCEKVSREICGTI